MLMQLGSILGTVLREVVPAGLDIGRQFLNRELTRDARRAEKNAIKQLQASQGLSTPSFVSQQGGAFSPSFTPTVPAAAPALVPRTGVPRFDLGRNVPAFTGPMITPAVNTNGAERVPGFATSFSQRFVLDKTSGCLREAMPGERGQFKIDRKTGDFVRVRARKINPANKSAAKRSIKRLDATLDFMSDLVQVKQKVDKGKTVPGSGGKVVSFRTTAKKKKRKCS